MKVNGGYIPLENPESLEAFLLDRGYMPGHIAVERNGEIVPRGSFAGTMLRDSDVIEIVRFVGGG